jgi:hypothetical protein
MHHRDELNVAHKGMAIATEEYMGFEMQRQVRELPSQATNPIEHFVQTHYRSPVHRGD